MRTRNIELAACLKAHNIPLSDVTKKTIKGKEVLVFHFEDTSRLKVATLMYWNSEGTMGQMKKFASAYKELKSMVYEKH